MERIGQADGAVGVYERVLAISPRETLARERWRTLVIARGDRAFTTGDFEGALAAYQEADADEKVATVTAAQRALILDKVHAEIGQLEERENWDGAAEGYRRLIEADPQNTRWSEGLKNVEKEANLARRYAEGLGAEQQNKLVEAQRAFADVIGLRPDYKDAADRLASLIRSIRAQPPAGISPLMNPPWTRSPIDEDATGEGTRRSYAAREGTFGSRAAGEGRCRSCTPREGASGSRAAGQGTSGS